jgi:flap endonuclease GEN
MTVASLWKVLDKAGCGKPVGAKEIVDSRRDSVVAKGDMNPWNINEPGKAAFSGKRSSLAVDLSIWICESLTSHAMSENHANPALHLVFTRTIKLLCLGIKLVFVIEGKRRIRGSGNENDKFHKRRSGTAFWKACRDCQEMLGLLGVPVVRAKAEGEALCALLNQRGIVDGVISHDGDCLLFGANIVFTKFSIENLENSQVMRYDLANLSAVVDASDDKDIPEAELGVLSLSRSDLIAFAIMTGSDLAGDGLPKVGQKKAVRFIRKCRLDNPLTPETAAIGEMKAWARAASADQQMQEVEKKKGDRCCTRCCHAGSKRHHEKHGCELCGTQAGEPCFAVTTDDRFRKSLRAKALAMQPKFDPSQVVAAYMRPNDNQIPGQFVGITSESLQMARPSMHALMRMPFIVKGRSLDTSRDYVKQSVARLMSRTSLFRGSEPLPRSDAQRQRLSREEPVPQRITKRLTQNQIPCYEVIWVVNATVTDKNGEGVDGYEYSTIEPRELTDARYPSLLTNFEEAEKEKEKQGDGEKMRRLAFLESLVAQPDNQEENGDGQQSPRKRKTAEVKKRVDFFQNKRVRQHQDYSRRGKYQAGDDVGHLLRFVINPEGKPSNVNKNDYDFSSIESDGATPIPKAKDKMPSLNRGGVRIHGNVKATPIMDADHSLFCNMGITVEITPIVSNHGAYPPRNVFIRSKSLPVVVHRDRDHFN